MLRDWYVNFNFRGCPFINTVLKIADASYQAHHISINLRKSKLLIILMVRVLLPIEQFAALWCCPSDLSPQRIHQR